MVKDGVLSITDEGHVYRHKMISHGKLIDCRNTRRIDVAGNKGYRRIHVQINGKVRNVSVHRLIWTIANGPIPDGLQINHKNGIKDDNRLDNLELVTPSENIRHALDVLDCDRPWKHATDWRPGRPKLTTKQRQEIREQRANGALLREIAADFGISTTHTHRIVSSREGPGE